MARLSNPPMDLSHRLLKGVPGLIRLLRPSNSGRAGVGLRSLTLSQLCNQPSAWVRCFMGSELQRPTSSTFDHKTLPNFRRRICCVQEVRTVVGYLPATASRPSDNPVNTVLNTNETNGFPLPTLCRASVFASVVLAFLSLV